MKTRFVLFAVVFSAVFCWALISGCASSPEPEPEIPPFEPGVYSNQSAAGELYLSAPVNMSGVCAILGTDKTGTYFITKSAYTDSHNIDFKWSDDSATSAVVFGRDRKTLYVGTAESWLWERYQ
jgi:hypothetical protein